MGRGDNSAPVAREMLKSFVERIERLDEEKRSIVNDIKDVYTEAKGNGFDVKALREIIRLRRQDAEQRAEHQAIVETYMHALGMLADLPLGRAAMERDLGVSAKHSVPDMP